MNKLQIGKTYKLVGNNMSPVIALHETNDGRAIFCWPSNTCTPFVSWAYQITGDDTIDCCYGKYYYTFEQAVDDLITKVKPTNLSLVYQFECTTDCDYMSKHTDDQSHGAKIPASWDNTVNLDNPEFQNIIEQVADGFICPECGNRGKILTLALYNDNEMIELMIGDKI